MGGRRHRSRKMRGGMGYGMSGTIGTAGALYTPSWGGEVTKAGAPVYDTADPQRGSSRRRKTRKGGEVEMVEATSAKETEISTAGIPGLRAAGAIEVMPKSEAQEKGYTIIGPAPKSTGSSRRRKSKKSKKGSRRRRTMRGGAGWQSVGAVGATFTGSGSRGLADYGGYAAKVPPAGGPTQNPDGAYRA